MATPHVSGAAALVLSRCDLDTADAERRLCSAPSILAGAGGVTTSGGRLNVNSALHACTAPPQRRPA